MPPQPGRVGTQNILMPSALHPPYKKDTVYAPMRNHPEQDREDTEQGIPALRVRRCSPHTAPVTDVMFAKGSTPLRKWSWQGAPSGCSGSCGEAQGLVGGIEVPLED